MNIDDALKYIKDIQNLSWKDLGYSDQMTRTLRGENSQFVNGVDADAYYEEGSFQGAQVQSISANRIITSVLRAVVNVGDAGGSAGLLIDGPNVRYIVNDGTTDRILIGKQVGGF